MSAQELLDWLQSLQGNWLGDGVHPPMKRADMIECLTGLVNNSCQPGQDLYTSSIESVINEARND